MSRNYQRNNGSLTTVSEPAQNYFLSLIRYSDEFCSFSNPKNILLENPIESH